tara:strand:+ start:402 stop:1001 length:600 start_codon:yes stop_codon:yes gene_type:complete
MKNFELNYQDLQQFNDLFKKCLDLTIKTQFSYINNFSNDLKTAILQDRSIFFCGNGGSFADSQHIVGELVVRLKKNRVPFNCLALGCNQSVTTAISNDFDYEKIFSRELEAYGREKDILVCLSTSGKSKNIISVLQQAQSIGISSWLFTGNNKNLNNNLSKNIYIQSNQTEIIQETYMHIHHYVCKELENYFYEYKKDF